MNPRVIFASTVFDDVETGPAIYAQYLWQAFRDDPDIEFHIVVPCAAEQHPRLHTIDQGDTSAALYHRIGRKTLAVAAGHERETIVHGNAAHAMFQFVDYGGPWIVQVNDYEAAEVWCRPVRIVRSYGLRRLASLVWRHRQEAKTIAAASRTVCNSDYTRQKVVSIYRPANPERVITIHKAVDVSAFHRPDQPPDDPIPDRPRGARLVFMGSDWRRKGLADLIEAVAVVAGRFPSVHLTVGGPSDPDSLGQLHRLVARAGVTKNVLLAGRIAREKLAAIYFHSDVFVLPTHDEALGVAIIEAMAAGLAVISCPVGGVREIIRSPDEGELVPPGDPKGLAAAIISMLEDAPRRKDVSRVGPQRADEFARSKMIHKIRRLYLQLASEPVAGRRRAAVE